MPNVTISPTDIGEIYMDTSDFQISRPMLTLRQQVEEKVRNAITLGKFKPGQRLVERELCELLGVGRTSIREALRQLEAEGLVENTPHKGPQVRMISDEEARQLYSVRALLEGYAGREFAQRREPKMVSHLKETLDEMEMIAMSGDHRSLVEAKAKFYEVLLLGSGNPFVSEMLTSLHNRISLMRAKSLSRPGRIPASMKEIRTVYQAIADGDGDAAETACKFHVEAAWAAAFAS